MENIVIIPKSSRQLAVIKDFLAEMKINFKTETSQKTKMNKEKFFAKIDNSLKEIETGKATRVRGKKQLQSFLEAL